MALCIKSALGALRVTSKSALVSTKLPNMHCVSAKLYSNSQNENSHSTSPKGFVTPSPYQPNRKPARYGYRQKLYDGGLLPRLDEEIKTLPKYNPGNAWSEKKALFGQNDYIDILGDGSIQPYENINGPRWLVGFAGNEYERTLRRLKWTGKKLAALHPKLNNDLNKRLRYLYREFNMGRRSHRSRSKKI